MSFKKIEHKEEFQSLLSTHEKLLLLKNSTTCPISHEAYRETESFAEENNDLPVYYLNVQELRELSSEVADKFKIKHESPQALLFSGGEVTWNASHWKITKKELNKAWEQ